MKLTRWAKIARLSLPAKIASVNWQPYSRLFIVGNSDNWSLSWDALELSAICDKLRIPVVHNADHRLFSKQCKFFTSRYFLMGDAWLKSENRIATPYYHGKPGTGYVEFDKCYDALIKHHDCLTRIQVTNSEMCEIVLDSGIDPQKVFLIPIGINLDYFPFRQKSSKSESRRRWNIPKSAFVIGSFQKDGNGWGDGNTPKLIKGPDVFVKTLAHLKKTVPEFLVLLSGPARGYVINELKRLEIKYRHVYIDNYLDIASLYHALDVYVVSSRQEGGPKAVLESMATGVPLVTTRVGQAIDLVEHEKNGWMVNVDDHEALAHWIEYVYENTHVLFPILSEGRRTAELNAYAAQDRLWSAFMNGFVRR